MRDVLSGQQRRMRQFLAGRADPVYLNLGSGPRGLDRDHWGNIDGFADQNVHFVFDFGRGLPFQNDSFDGVFCEHVIEHFTYEDVVRLCSEIARILKPGGVARIVVPDAERIVRTYIDDPAKLADYRGLAGLIAMQVVNELFRQRYEHQLLCDWETMQRLLGEAGLAEAARCQPGAGRCADLLIDDEKYGWESLFAEAAKVQPARP